MPKTLSLEENHAELAAACRRLLARFQEPYSLTHVFEIVTLNDVRAMQIALANADELLTVKSAS